MAANQTILKLLTTTHPKYVARLIRELNSLPDGFYVCGDHLYPARDHNPRCRKARKGLTGGITATTLNGESLSLGWTRLDTAFMDAYGRTVIASRSIR